MYFFLIVTFLVSVLGSSVAQKDSSQWTMLLDTFTVYPQLVSDANRGYSIHQFTSIDITNESAINLDEFLSLNTSVFIKDYGPSGISTLSFRGGSAAQSAILWEGVNIQNPQLGLSDLSLIPMSFMDHLDVLQGANTSSNGNSGLNGTLFMHTRPHFNSGWKTKVNMRIGMYEQFDQNLRLSYGGKTYAGDIRFMTLGQRNNFHYWDNQSNSQPVLRQLQNGRRHQFGYMTNHHLVLKNNELSAKCWFVDSKRQLPPNLLQSSSDEVLEDRLLRSMFSWRSTGFGWFYHAKLLFLLDDQTYYNAALESHNISYQWILDQSFEQTFSSGVKYGLGLQGQFVLAESSGYASLRSQMNISPTIHVQIPLFNDRVLMRLSSRFTVSDSIWYAPSFNWGVDVNASEHWKIRWSLSHNYRLPSLNDQFWQQGGNPTLRPEYAWNFEAGAVYKNNVNSCNYLMDVQLFQTWIEDWILWLPQSNGLWEVSNIHRVWNKGGHISFKIGGRFNQFIWDLNVNYTLALPTQYDNPDIIQNGKRIIYAPDHTLQSRAMFEYQKFRCTLSHQVVSSRFLDAYNSQQLPLYHMGTVEVSYDCKINNVNANIWLRLNNAYGHSYQIVSLRPMPLQIVQVGIKLATK